MTTCDKCGKLTSQPLADSMYKGKLIFRKGMKVCRKCFDKALEGVRAGDERKPASCDNSKRAKKNYTRVVKSINQQSKVQK